MLKSALISSLALLLLSTASCKKEAPAGGGSGSSTTTTPPTEAAPTPTPTAPAGGDAGSAAGTPAAPTGDAAGSAATAPATPAPAGALPAEFKEFDALLSPLVAMPEGEARSKKTCEQLEQLRVKSLPVRRYAATGVDAAAWEKASNEMRGGFEGLGSICGDDSPDESADLKTIHQAYQQLVSLLPK